MSVCACMLQGDVDAVYGCEFWCSLIQYLFTLRCGLSKRPPRPLGVLTPPQLHKSVNVKSGWPRQASRHPRPGKLSPDHSQPNFAWFDVSLGRCRPLGNVSVSGKTFFSVILDTRLQVCRDCSRSFQSVVHC